MKQERKKLKFEVHIVEHCNLNCKGCFHFSNIAKPEFLDVEEYQKDVDRLSVLYDGEVELALLLGGEPLLHKEINKFMTITREAFPIGKIGLVTNGILLPQMDDDFWLTCKENDIVVMPTQYPINVDYSYIEDKAKQYGVQLEYFNDSKVEKKLSVLSIDNNGTQDIQKNFAECYRSNFCITLEHGRLYTCIVPAHIRHYIQEFHLDLGDFETDGIDIYSVKSAKEINEFLVQPIRACAYCNREKWRDGVSWSVTERSIKEWQ